MSTHPPASAQRITRVGQVALGLLWLTDGALQFQPYMFGRTFITGVILPAAAGQPGIIGGPITWIARLIQPQVALFNGGAATLQVLIGLGLLYRPTVKPALLVSLVWASSIWFAGEGLGMIFTGSANPLTGAPGAASLYIVAALLCWPAGGRRIYLAARSCWLIVWLVSATLWLLPANDGAGSLHDAIASAPSGAHWLSGLLGSAASATSGLGTMIAIGLAVVSAAIGLSLASRYHARLFLVVAIVISLCFWIIGQGLGGVLTGQATDVGTAPLMALTAALLLARERTEPSGVSARLVEHVASPARALTRSAPADGHRHHRWGRTITEDMPDPAGEVTVGGGRVRLGGPGGEAGHHERRLKGK